MIHIKHIACIPLLLLLISAAATPPSGDEPSATPVEAISQFLSAVRGNDVQRAVALTVPIDGLPPDVMTQYYQRLGKSPAQTQIVGHLQVGEHAVVILWERRKAKPRTPDLDPAFLVRRDGKWLVLFKLTRFEGVRHGLTDSEVAGLQKLKKWFDAQTPGLQEMIAADIEES